MEQNTNYRQQTQCSQPTEKYTYPTYVHTPYVKPENKFKPEMSDFIFALVMFAIGYLFSRWVLFSWIGWGVTVFTTIYLSVVTIYLAKKGTLHLGTATYFWFAATFITGMSYMLWDNAGISGYRVLFLFLSAIYYVVTASGRLIMGKTSNYLIVDGINAAIILPFRNFFNQYVSFGVFKGKGKGVSKILPVILGAVIAIILLLILVPMLRSADSGGFAIILDFLAEIFTIDWDTVIEVLFYGFFAIPVAAYIYGLVSGASFGKGTDVIHRESVSRTVSSLRVAHTVTVNVALITVIALYLVFIFAQMPYFFSAFTGNRPEGWLIYSQYARQGFFELCGICAINIALVTLANVLCKKQRMDGNRLLKILNIALACVTLVLIATAFSKMALYIDAYGLTMPRLLPCVVMVFLAAVFVALIVLQQRSFSIVRFALVLGAVILCVMFIINPDALVVRYNTDRYLAGTLTEYDTEVLYRSRYAGVLPAIEVLESTTDAAVKIDITNYLSAYFEPMLGKNGAHMYSIESYRALNSRPSAP